MWFSASIHPYFQIRRLFKLRNNDDKVNSQGLIIAEKELLFEVDINGFSVVDGLIALLAAYYIFYVKYPKSTPAAGFLLFLQEIILESPERSKKTSTYASLINSIVE